jgi:hypothetical protein
VIGGAALIGMSVYYYLKKNFVTSKTILKPITRVTTYGMDISCVALMDLYLYILLDKVFNSLRTGRCSKEATNTRSRDHGNSTDN